MKNVTSKLIFDATFGDESPNFLLTSLKSYFSSCVMNKDNCKTLMQDAVLTHYIKSDVMISLSEFEVINQPAVKEAA